jgi:hypothetical protein
MFALIRERFTRIGAPDVLIQNLGISNRCLSPMTEVGAEIFTDTPNQAAAVNAPIASWFQFGHPWRRVTEQRR